MDSDAVVLKRVEHPRARAELAAFFDHINKIRPGDDDDFECKQDDSDGVACRLESDIESIQQKKLDQIRAINEAISPSRETFDEDGGNDINKRGRYGYTQLTVAVLNNDLAMVKLLVSQGARHDIPDKGGHTQWDKAYVRGFDDILRVFDPSFVRTGPIQSMNWD